MDDLKNDKKNLDRNKPEVLHINDGRAEKSNVMANEFDEKPKSDAFNKQPARKPRKIKSAPEIFYDTFSVKKDRDGKVKPARITKTDLSALCSADKIEELDHKILETICNNAVLTDPDLRCVTEIILQTMGCKASDYQKTLFKFCIKIVSGVWVHKHRGALDLFEELFEDSTDQTNIFHYMESSIDEVYKKRQAALTKMSSANLYKSSDKDDDAEKNEGVEKDIVQNKKVLKAQKSNVLIIGALWLLEKEKVGIESLFDYFIEYSSEKSSAIVMSRKASLYLVSQYLASETQFLTIISALKQKADKSKAIAFDAKTTLYNQKQLNLKVQEQLSTQKTSVEGLHQQISDYEAQIEDLKKQLEDQQLDERASRTHMRDNEGKVRSKAFNLLSEEVVEPLQLSLSALEKGKIPVAIHKIELILESVERDLSWFKR